MKRLAYLLGIVVLLSWFAVSQTSTPDPAATKEDVEKYFQVVRSHDMMNKLAVAMSQGTRQMLHEQYLKHKDELPADYETKMAARINDMIANMPWEEMMQAMIPVYQKHFTKADIDSLIAFYSSPTGDKLLRDMPSIMEESMQNATPTMLKYIETVRKRCQEETDVMIAQSKKKANSTPAVP